MVNKTKSVLVSDVKIRAILLKKKALSLTEKLKEILMQSLLKHLRIQLLKETSNQKKQL